MRRRDILRSALIGATALAAPNIVTAETQRVLKFLPQADLATLDPVWTTADITRNHEQHGFDLLYGLDENFRPHPQMVEGHTSRRRLTLGADAARRPALPRRREGAGARLHRVHPALGEARCVRQCDDQPHG